MKDFSKQRERLDRLMKELPDGSYEVAGYQKLEGGKVWHTTSIDIFPMDDWTDIRKEHDSAIFDCIGDCEYIPHDRIDQYTGRDLENGTKIFERDEGLLDGHVSGDCPVTVVYEAPSFKVKHPDGVLYDLNEYFYKITGIAGVNKKQGESQCKQPVQ